MILDLGSAWSPLKIAHNTWGTVIGSPTHSPRLFCPPAHQPPLLAGLRLGKQAHELSSLIGPPSRRLNPEDHQSRPGPRAHKFWVLLSFCRLAAVKATPSTSAAPSSGSPITGRIDCELRSTEQWQPVNCNFESSCIHLSRTRTFQIQISCQNVRGDAPAHSLVALSRANSRLLNTPARAQAAR